MSRKKKVDNFIPSKYQSAIYDWVEHSQGNAVIEASAGSGKSTTLIHAISLIPSDKQVLLTAFNNDITKELSKKASCFDNVRCLTMHSLGLSMCKSNLGYEKCKLDQYKYLSEIRNGIHKYSNVYRSLYKNKNKYIDNIIKYVDFGRFYLCQSLSDLDMIEDRYSIETMADEKEIAIKVMEWGKKNIDEIDFTDMVWLPNVLSLKPYGCLFDYIMVDECQDLNRAERELLLKCTKIGTRMVSCGDENQCLYSFAGSDPNSFKALKTLPNTISLPLSISYRCPKKVVEFVQKLVPSIEANETNEDGEILYDVELDEVQDGDMVLCRNNAPLLKAYNDFLKMGKKAYIRGKDIGGNLKSYIKKFNQDKINKALTSDGLYARMYADLLDSRDDIIMKKGVSESDAMDSQIVQSKLDMIMAIDTLSEGINSVDELIDKIDEIFGKKKKKDGISLSTIHKAKGLEADNVYIICKSLMPNKSAKKDWEILQEHNLMYVAYTRAKKKLAFVSEEGFDKYNSSSEYSKNTLKNIELKVNYLLNRNPLKKVTAENAKDIVSCSTELNKSDSMVFKPTKIIKMDTLDKKSSSLSKLKKNKKILRLW